MELDTHLELSIRLGYTHREELGHLLQLVDEVSRMLNRLIRMLRESK